MCTGQLINLMFPFNVFKQDSVREKKQKTMKEKEVCDPWGISMVASHFSAVFFYCIPCRRSRFSQDLTWLQGLLYTSSRSVSCFQPR